MSETVVVVVADADILASTVAARLAIRIIDAQAVHGTASVVLTGGRVAAKVLGTLRDLPAAAAIDWSRVDLWWGDERFLPSGDPDRNETQARAALLDALPLDPARVHAMPASDGPDGDDATAAAARYAAELTAAGDGALPRFDVLMLGVGEDGHVASLFPGHPVLKEEGAAVATFNSPKPPPTRITLTLPTIGAADEVWLVAAGPDKAGPIATALAGGDLPAARAKGVRRTLFLLDEAAAAKR
ncbi:6-phosphogluconolactonase [Actinoplanes teichomyceticus]|uniref:6-phosphogluconolactonase n=1 Tax=Actinoplanes teichomyceticus TaxID=1867 RepID=A0A561WJC3_ACTTI|nr:6-phosphogluconolactonase [Actinoplanes teichomyceticus]TWG23979.1 6-phosphogluconolactonase [Actinoplanes teichomyceticus]GIF12021.1 6-phosphogluconolactonase [Actinoplanes teichomyceticus]